MIMDSKIYVETYLQNHGFSEAKADETIVGTSKVLDSTQYIAASRNRLNSGILRNECVVLLNPIGNEEHLNDSVFSGISKLRDDQYVLVQQYPEESLWNVYQGFCSNGMMRLIHKRISLEMFLVKRHLANQQRRVFQSSSSSSNKQKSFTPSQIIYYGVPGCGKSEKIMDLLDIAKQKGEITDEEKQVVRVVFHPEYTNADFVGQVMPVVKPAGGVDYDFAAGPFTRILARAYANPTKPYFLVIEEINRGNAAAIFGEIFQLLDRHKKGESDSVGGNLYTAGWSKYFVDHVDVNGKISAEIAGTEYGSDEEKPDITFTANTAIRLPPNLSIYATMNTSDQNVFTLDNAFKRRFDSELVKNTLDGEQHKAQRETKIENTDVTWGTFWEKINDLILEKNTSMISSEDKRLGAYFIIGEEKTDDAGNKYCEVSRKLFGEKVLEYLWDDAFKYKRKEVFAESCKSVESLIENFEEGGFTAIFKDGILGL